MANSRNYSKPEKNHHCQTMDPMTMRFLSYQGRNQNICQYISFCGKFQTQPTLKASPLCLPKQLWSTIMQLKLAHGYFRSYLVRRSEYDDDSCPYCHRYVKQTPHHLLFQCSSQSEIRQKTISHLHKRDQHLYNLFITKKGQEQLIQFLKDSKIATRQWIKLTAPL